eukprot:TRINITY_DN218_c0_g2_i1.p1 TRINITY_DN218_c0_g2~~TRINITY_DN218_c0_g2_i1.p1  ORF type:complete len:103 (+),score=0.19 TRINITY_DN218_c0_g2_i1:80-388(+)
MCIRDRYMGSPWQTRSAKLLCHTAVQGFHARSFTTERPSRRNRSGGSLSLGRKRISLVTSYSFSMCFPPTSTRSSLAFTPNTVGTAWTVSYTHLTLPTSDLV